MTTEKKDPLASLFTNDAKVVDRQQLATLVGHFFSFDQDSKEFNVLPTFSRIEGNMAKIEILLAAAKARSLFLNEPDGLLPSEIIAIEIMAEGSVKSSLKKLLDTHKIKKDKENRYLVPAYRISELVNQFTSNNSKDYDH